MRLGVTEERLHVQRVIDGENHRVVRAQFARMHKVCIADSLEQIPAATNDDRDIATI